MSLSLIVIAGPCVMESLEQVLHLASSLSNMLMLKRARFVFKASYDKANRSSLSSYRGPGLHLGLEWLSRVKKEVGCPILTDVHTPEEVDYVREVADILQIPAFLCRQTDLIVAAGQSGRCVNIKKGQFLAPWDMKNVVEKLHASGCREMMLTERGTTFGYQNLVTDLRAIPILQRFGYPVIFDATHSVQLPGAGGHQSGGNREFILPLSKGALAAGCDGIFAETHLHPEHAKSDAATQLPLQCFESYVDQWIELFELIQVQKCNFLPSSPQ